MKKILHVFSSFELGGAQARFLKLVESHSDQFQHFVFAADGRYDAKTKMPALPIQTLENYTVAKGFLSSNLGVAKKMFQQVQPDLVVSYNWGAVEWVIYSGLMNFRHIHVEDGFGLAEFHNRKFRRSFFRTLVFRLTRAKMVVISRTLQTIASAEWHIRERQLVYIPNGVSVDHSQTGIASKTLKKTGLVVGTVCGLRPEKRVDRIVDAFALLTDQFPDLELWIVGEGSERKRLELLVESKSLTHKVQFIGHLSEPFGVMRQFDVFCLTSDTEQAPLSLLEAMALGLPCVATSVGDVPNMVSKENKPFLCQLSAQSVASALEAMLQDRNAMQLIGMANRAAYLDQFQFAESSSKWMKVFSEK